MSLKSLVEGFNRKERNWLVRDALGSACKRIDGDFIDRVSEQVRKVEPAFAFDDSPYWAIDFHLDWLVGVLHRLAHPDDANDTPIRNAYGMVKGSQEDIDLVVATGDTLLLIEAKGEGGWSNTQIASKVSRLSAMTGTLINDRGYTGRIRVVFLLCAPRHAPRNLKVGDAPKWMLGPDKRFLHFRLKGPRGSLFAVSRCNEMAQRKATSTHWMFRQVSPGDMQDEAAPAEV